MTAYLEEIKEIVRSFDPVGANRYFVFGSAVREKRYHDIDIGIVGNTVSRKNIGDLRDKFYDSHIPYPIDVVDFDSTDADFQEYVFKNENVVWIP